MNRTITITLIVLSLIIIYSHKLSKLKNFLLPSPNSNTSSSFFANPNGSFFANHLGSFFAKTKETFKEDNENSFAIKNFKIQDTILLSKKLFINRNKGQPNIYVFYKTKNI